MKEFMKTMNFQKFKELIEKSEYNKWTKEDMLDLMYEHPEYADWSRAELEQKVRDLNWEAQSIYETVNRLESEASILSNLIILMYGE